MGLLETYRLGDRVDVIADSALHKGLPHKFYHGRTGVVYNVTPRGLGVIVNKYHRNGKILAKRICVRFTHCRRSRCAVDTEERIRTNEAIKRESKESGVGKPTVKRVPGAPKAGKTAKVYKMNFLGARPVKFEDLYKV